MQVIGAPDDFQDHPKRGGDPGDEFAGVAAVGPGEFHAGKRAPQVPQQRFGAVAVLGAGGGDHDRQQQPGGVNGDVAFAAVYFLALVPAAAGLGMLSAARIDCESMTAAVGPGIRPAAARTCSRNWSWICCRVPSSREVAE